MMCTIIIQIRAYCKKAEGCRGHSAIRRSRGRDEDACPTEAKVVRSGLG
ncbi:hypothetical protein WJ0W_001283 [Paenibacillus melissococcoides]|uniref:Uncharacterized protein n=1 Tax=Paenibacillus melissococcoides TaxID=2912268 RepID=A0ABN8U353_9BACL|nr:hypothetical protein WJ0W_001283 [Paenibacillus melissococcoides]